MDLRRIFGPSLTILGIIVIIYACVAFLSDGAKIWGLSVSQSESIVPFVVGMIFFLTGMSLIKQV